MIRWHVFGAVIAGSVILLGLTAVSVPMQQGEDGTAHTTGVFEGCPSEGNGGDQTLNRLKNRDMAPKHCDSLTIDDMLSYKPELIVAMGQKKRNKWSSAAIVAAQAEENRGISVEGYLIAVKQEGPEHCNCQAADKRDFHLWLAATSDDSKAHAVVVEVSPRLLPKHPTWRLHILTKLVKEKVPVRISGWVMWDGEHLASVTKSRGTCWEIHPIHKIEVKNGANWQEL